MDDQGHLSGKRRDHKPVKRPAPDYVDDPPREVRPNRVFDEIV